MKNVVFSFLIIKTMDPEPDSLELPDPDPDLTLLCTYKIVLQIYGTVTEIRR
jgi:hypothetical protein